MIEYPSVLDLSPYLSDPSPTPILYDLRGVTVHLGSSLHGGHYYAFVKGPNDIWYRADDCHVAPTDARHALGQKAYLLFYQVTTTMGA
jgi:ubiquitin carboxyl-terminal hydrolase 36/42